MAGPKTGSSYPQGKTPSQSQGVGKGQLADFSQPSATSSQLVSSISRPSSNYSNRSSHSVGGGQRGMPLLLLVLPFLTVLLSLPLYNYYLKCYFI